MATLGTKTAATGERTVVLSPVEVAVMRRRLDRERFEERAAEDGWCNVHGLVFTTTIGTPISPRNFGHAGDRLTVRVLGRRLHPQPLRHGAATAMAEAGVSLKAAQGVLGHSSAAMRAHYTHEQKTQLVRAAETRQAFLASNG